MATTFLLSPQSTEEKVIMNNLGLLKLAEMLGNVSEAYKVMGYSFHIKSELLQLKRASEWGTQPHPRLPSPDDGRLQHAVTQRERLQRQRQREYVPAPVKVSVEGVQ